MEVGSRSASAAVFAWVAGTSNLYWDSRRGCGQLDPATRPQPRQAHQTGNVPVSGPGSSSRTKTTRSGIASATCSHNGHAADLRQRMLVTTSRFVTPTRCLAAGKRSQRPQTQPIT
jgi:hypothetical protein